MLQSAKHAVKSTPLYDLFLLGRETADVRAWERMGRPAPPPRGVKQRVVKAYAARFALRTLVETGTFLGEMLYATRRAFSRIYSIELDPALSERARRKFAAQRHITIVHGDSAATLPAILERIHEPCLFWLDGHYSGGYTAKGALETPIVQELGHIFGHPLHGHVVLIDDARLYNGEGDWPTLDELRAFVARARPGWVFEVRDDVIRIHAPTPEQEQRTG